MAILKRLGPAWLIATPGVEWVGAPAPSFAAGAPVGTSYNVTSSVRDYNVATDTITVFSGAVPAWCPFNGTAFTVATSPAPTDDFGPITLHCARIGATGTNSPPFNVVVSGSSDIIFDQGTSWVEDISSFYPNWDPAYHETVQASGSVPGGVTVQTDAKIAYNGTSPGAAPVAVTVRGRHKTLQPPAVYATVGVPQPQALDLHAYCLGAVGGTDDVLVPANDTVIISLATESALRVSPPDAVKPASDALLVLLADSVAAKNISPGGASTALGDFAATVPVGQWREFTGHSGMNSMLSQGGSAGNILPYCNKAPWNPISKRIEILGSDHGGSFVHRQYDAPSNSFIASAALPVTGGAHGYDHQATRPNGDLYHRQYAQGSGLWPVWLKSSGGGWAQTTSYASNTNVAIGTCYWSGSVTGGGAQGAYVMYEPVNEGNIFVLNPLSPASYTVINNIKPAGWYMGDEYHSVMAYSAGKNVACFGGGGGNGGKVARLNSNLTSTAMPDVPSGKAIGVQDGIFDCDPATGNFLLLSSGQLWELNPNGSGTWTQKTSPPSGVGVPNAPSFHSVISCSIPEYGVVVYLTMFVGTGTFWVYKNA